MERLYYRSLAGLKNARQRKRTEERLREKVAYLERLEAHDAYVLTLYDPFPKPTRARMNDVKDAIRERYDPCKGCYVIHVTDTRIEADDLFQLTA